MITDIQTNSLYLADCLPKQHPAFFADFERVLSSCDIPIQLLPDTKKISDLFKEEYRIHTFRQNPMTMEERIINVPAEAFTKLILGKHMTQTSKDDLISSIHADLNHIEIIER